MKNTTWEDVQAKYKRADEARIRRYKKKRRKTEGKNILKIRPIKSPKPKKRKEGIKI